MRISAHSVCTAIRDEIIAGALTPGSRLTADLLECRYGVSRGPVRGTLRTLDSVGFVTTRPHAGAFVAELTSRDAADLLDVRLLLEPLGAARAAQRRTEAHPAGAARSASAVVASPRGTSPTCANSETGSTKR